MGLEASTFKNLETNEYLIKLCSSENLSTFDPIWNKLFSHSLKPVLNKEEDFILELSIEKLRGDLVIHNLETKNVSALIEVFTSRAKELQTSVQTSDNIFIWQAYNGLFIIRSIIKYLLCSLNEEEVRLHFRRETPHVSGDGGGGNGDINGLTFQAYDNSLELLLDTLCRLLLELPVTKITYMLHLEAVNTMIVILSQQLYVLSKPGYRFLQYRFLMGNDPETSTQLTKRLIENYLDGSKPPYPVWNTSGNGSIVIGMASGIWNMLRKGAGFSPTEDEVMGDLKEHNLAKQSLYLLLLLVNHSTGERKNPSTNNPYLIAIKSFKNNSEHKDLTAEELPPAAPQSGPSSFTVSYAKLYARICDQLQTDETTLLLYILIFGNQEFMSYIMGRSDIENLIIPILKTLYNAPKSASHHIYMSLILLLILSQEDLFNRQIHDIMLKNITWYTDRNLPEISLGGLIILVIFRTIQYNILKMRDKYLHTNCLAALANMSSQFRSLNSYVAQRILSVFEILGKRYVKLSERAKRSKRNAESLEPQPHENEMTQDLDVLDEVLRMILEILNSTLTNSLTHNQQLVYTLLYKKEIFEAFRTQDSTQDLVANLDTVINYFTKRLGSDHNNLTASQVMECVKEGILHWKPEILKKFPELQFRYVEEESPEAFFVPYIWTLIYQKSGIHWNSPNMELYSLEPEVCV